METVLCWVDYKVMCTPHFTQDDKGPENFPQKPRQAGQLPYLEGCVLENHRGTGNPALRL